MFKQPFGLAVEIVIKLLTANQTSGSQYLKQPFQLADELLTMHLTTNQRLSTWSTRNSFVLKIVHYNKPDCMQKTTTNAYVVFMSYF